MVRNAMSMQNLRSDMSGLHLSPTQTQNNPQAPPTSSHASGAPQQTLQTLGSRHSMQLCGQDGRTKALMNRIATGQASDADQDEFNRHVQGTYRENNVNVYPPSASPQYNVPSIDVNTSSPEATSPIERAQIESIMRRQDEYMRRFQKAGQLEEDTGSIPVNVQSMHTQFAPSNTTAQTPYTSHVSNGNHALQDYQMQLMLLEQQKRKRKEMATREQEDERAVSPSKRQDYSANSLNAVQPNWSAIAPSSPISTTTSRGGMYDSRQTHDYQDPSRLDYQTQLLLLEEQNKKRLEMAKENGYGTGANHNHGAMQGVSKPTHEASNEGRLDYERQLELLEQQNRKRLQMAREEQDRMRFPVATGSAAEVWCKPFCDFLTENPTVFHAVDTTKKELKSAGWTELNEREAWDIKTSGRYFVERNGSSLIAFVVGANYEPGHGAAILAGHVDALCAKLKPFSEVPNKAGYLQLGVAPYAGAMSDTWWDRDLGIGGRVLIMEGNKVVTKLVKLDWPIARIPSLAPHFGAAAQPPFNKETQMTPIIGLEGVDSPPIPVTAGSAGAAFVSKQPPALVRAIGDALGLSEKTYTNIVNWELELFDIQPATVGGLNKEFIYGGRIDDKLCSWAAMQALTGSSLYDTRFSSLIKVVAWFDNEEIGSQLRQGARSNFLPSVLERAVGSLSKLQLSSVLMGTSYQLGSELMGRTYANSFLVSSDVTHAVNPNFLNAYLDNHAPRLNTGLVVASDANGHMTTDAVSTAILHRCAERVGAKLQVFQIRNDSRSGGTVGPMLSSMTGIRAIDAGLPQLSMHSIRATTGSLDPGLGVIMFTGFLNGFEQVDKEFRS